LPFDGQNYSEAIGVQLPLPLPATVLLTGAGSGVSRKEQQDEAAVNLAIGPEKAKRSCVPGAS
jgi:hypothetical protein